ncbi:hypothetical protein [Bradyrhizobium erythrophlei]|uniref:Uncharacterized protein n=1 Tax=Bradyrhizobium erythrophlei TaxID=1437360 RepID=A0A1H4XVJ8_9BRAD|nr:hypothetical protein [Bradyrhizobium erythrophlei]SED09557.1 hypothetical protein SAMN05444164_3674 [Bradyrhizobium erythrophlei]
MLWRRKPAHFLRYWSGPVDRNAGFKTVLVFCVGCQHHNGRLKLADFPDWDWSDISAHLKCTACGKVGWVDTRMDWFEVINFAKGVSG